MKPEWVRHKHLQLDRTRQILEAKTESQALDRALSIVVTEADIDTSLGKVRGRGRIRRVFR